MENEKYLFVVSGPSGVGKDSVIHKLREDHPEIEKTTSVTTRAPREGESDGVHYYFRTQEQFQSLLAAGEILESNCFCENYYGTLRSEVEKRLQEGKFVLLNIDVHGALDIKRIYPGATTIMLLPPSETVLENRLRGRGSESEEAVRSRLETSKAELAWSKKFDLTLVNDDLDRCAKELYTVMAQHAGLQA